MRAAFAAQRAPQRGAAALLVVVVLFFILAMVYVSHDIAVEREPHPTNIHLRGEFKQLGSQVEPGFPSFLPKAPTDTLPPPTGVSRIRWWVRNVGRCSGCARKYGRSTGLSSTSAYGCPKSESKCRHEPCHSAFVPSE